MSAPNGIPMDINTNHTDRLFRGPLAHRDADRTPTGNDTRPQAGMDFGPTRPLGRGRVFRHHHIRCRADEISAQEYQMDDGNTVIAFCAVSAREFYQLLSTEEKYGRTQAEQDASLL